MREGGVRNPLDQLERSHRRLEEACDALSIAGSDHDIDTVASVCAFFARQVRRHEDDEDSSLFPRLAQMEASSDALRSVIEELSREHREHEALHERLAALSSALQASAPGAPPVWAELADIAERLTRGYRVHIEVEERQVFPEARRLLSATALEEMSAEMDARRGR